MTNRPITSDARTAGEVLSVIRTFPLMITYAIGFMSATYLPVWVGATSTKYAVSVSRVGLIGSYELGAVALATILTAALRSPGSRRSPMAAGLVGSIACNLLAAKAPTLALFLGARIGAGLANGFLLAEVNARAAAAPAPSRIFAGQLFVMVIFAVIFFGAAPYLLAALGPGAPFFYCATAGILALLSLPKLYTGPRSESGAAATASFRIRTPAVLLLAAPALLFITMNSVWPYLSPEASRAGVALVTYSKVLAAGAVTNLLAPILSVRLLRSHISPVLVVTVGIISMTVCAALITEPTSATAFIFGALLLPFFLIFLVPFYLTFLVKLDRSGKFVAASSAFFMIGSAIGPGVGGIAMDRWGLAGLPIVGISTPLLALLATWAGSARHAHHASDER